MGQNATTVLRLTCFSIGSVKLCFEKRVYGDHFYVFTTDSASQRCRALRPYIPTYMRGREGAFCSGMKEHWNSGATIYNHSPKNQHLGFCLARP